MSAAGHGLQSQVPSRPDGNQATRVTLELMLGALVNVPAGIGYPLLFALVSGESAGLLLPGETALIAAAVLAGQGQLSLPLVIAVAAGAAILGDNIGYVLGRRGLRSAFDRPSSPRRQRLFAQGEGFFERHGSAAVFFGRWIPGLRIAAAWLAGASAMPWRRFVFWNALGGIGWAASVGAVAYFLGQRVSGALGIVGLIGLVVLGAVLAARRLRNATR
jgi:membrane protein DedA with SNARE-associated domain